MKRTIAPGSRNVKLNLYDNLNIIRKVAWKYARQFELDFDDLFQEASLACIEALPKYRPERGAFTTFLWHTATNAIKDLLSKYTTYEVHHHLKEEISATKDDDLQESPLDLLFAEEKFLELWATLSPEAREVCEIVIYQRDLYFTSPSGQFRRPIHLPTDKPKRSKMILERILMQKGWTRNQVKATFREIQQALATR